MSNLEATLKALLDEVRKEQTSPNNDRYQEGYKAGFQECHRRIQEKLRDGLNDVIKGFLETSTDATPPPTRQKVAQQERLPAPTKDQLVREYLKNHPGARYRDMNRDLGTYVATRVYALAKRGEVVKDEEGRFYLSMPTGDHHGAPH